MEKQAQISRQLIFSIIVLLLIFFLCTPATENEQIYQVVAMLLALTVLTGMYTFSYGGKPFRFSKILFFLLLLLSALAVWAVMYMIALAQAFKN